MRLHWNESQLELRSRYAALGSDIASARTCTDVFDHAGWRSCAEAGIWRLAIPSSAGGHEQTWWEFAAALEGLASTVDDLGLLLSMIAHAGCVRVVQNHGSDLQRRQLLPTLLGGGIGATAITEDTGGSDVARLQTVATAAADGYVLSGAKAHITNAPIADLFVIVGRIPALGARDITLFLCERGAAGLTCSEAEQMLGNHSSPTGAVLLDRMTAAGHQVLGTAGDGLRLLYDMISLDRALYGLVAAAHSEQLLLRCLRFSNERRSFKRPICEHQYVQLRMTDIKIAIETSRATAYTALDHLIRRTPEAQLMCSLAKLVGSEGLWLSAQHGVQIHGHKGYMSGPVSDFLRDAAGTRIAGGTSDIQRVNIFNQLQKLAGYEA